MSTCVDNLSNKVKIPMSLLLHIVSFLEDLEIEDYPPDTILSYGYILHTLKRKKNIIESAELKNNRCNCSLWSEDYPF